MTRISITDASRQFGVATNTIRRRVRQGDITPFSKQHGLKTRYYFDVADLVRIFGEPTKMNHGTEPNIVHGERQVTKPVDPIQNTIQELRSEISTLQEKNAGLEKEKAVLEVKIEGLLVQATNVERHLEDLRKILAPRLEGPKSIRERVRQFIGS